MNREEFLKKSGDKSKVKGYAEFDEAGSNNGKKSYDEFKPTLPFKPKDNGDKPKPPTSPAGGAAALPVPAKKAAMKKEEFKSFSEWLSTRSPSS